MPPPARWPTRSAKAGGDVLDVAVVPDGGTHALEAQGKLEVEGRPEVPPECRGALSLARRFQDPLAELVTIDPKALALGPHLHDVHQGRLRMLLDETVEACTAYVGVDPNVASADLLARVPGLPPAGRAFVRAVARRARPPRPQGGPRGRTRRRHRGRGAGRRLPAASERRGSPRPRAAPPDAVRRGGQDGRAGRHRRRHALRRRQCPREVAAPGPGEGGPVPAAPEVRALPDHGRPPRRPAAVRAADPAASRPHARHAAAGPRARGSRHPRDALRRVRRRRSRHGRTDPHAAHRRPPGHRAGHDRADRRGRSGPRARGDSREAAAHAVDASGPRDVRSPRRPRRTPARRPARSQ